MKTKIDMKTIQRFAWLAAVLLCPIAAAQAQIALDRTFGASTHARYRGLVEINGETKMLVTESLPNGDRGYNIVDFAGNPLSAGLWFFPGTASSLLTLPPQHRVEFLYEPSYVTSGLFDTDPGLEVLMWYEVIPDSVSSRIPSYYGVAVCDWHFGVAGFPDFVTVIAQIDSVDRPSGWYEVNGRGIQILNTDHGAKMVLDRTDGGISVYSLPGTLDCPDHCAGNSIVAKTDEVIGKESGIAVYPNPTNGLTVVAYDLPGGTAPAYLEVLDLQGRLVLRHPVTSPGPAQTLDLSHAPSGTYVVRALGTGTEPQVLATRVVKL